MRRAEPLPFKGKNLNAGPAACRSEFHMFWIVYGYGDCIFKLFYCCPITVALIFPPLLSPVQPTWKHRKQKWVMIKWTHTCPLRTGARTPPLGASRKPLPHQHSISLTYGVIFFCLFWTLCKWNHTFSQDNYFQKQKLGTYVYHWVNDMRYLK